MGVLICVFMLKDKLFDSKCVLINLYGGVFLVCVDVCVMFELILIVLVGGFKVVSVNYWMVLEFKYFVVVEDVVVVYCELLKIYDLW